MIGSPLKACGDDSKGFSEASNNKLNVIIDFLSDKESGILELY